jgi:hypothetical protein
MNVYNREDLERLSMAVSQSLIENIGWIVQSEREEIAAKVQGIIENSTSDNIKNNYSTVLKTLNDHNK